MTWCAETDPLARRLTFILSSFRDVVSHQQESTRTRRIAMTLEDPISGLVGGSSNEATPEQYNTVSSANVNRIPSISGLSHAGVTGGPAAASVPLSAQPSNPASVPSSMTHSPEGGVRHSSIDGEGEIDFDAFWNLPQGGYTQAQGPAVQAAYNANNPQGFAGIVPLFGAAEFKRQ
jgi:hypothetical protein